MKKILTFLIVALTCTGAFGFAPSLRHSPIVHRRGSLITRAAENRVQVSLTKPMGLVFEENDPKLGGIYVSEVGEGSVATGKVEVKDQLVSIDGASTLGMGFDDAMDLLVEADSVKVALQFARGEDPVLLHNPRTFFDIEIDGAPAGRLEFTLRADVVPDTANNFRILCEGKLGSTKRYKDSRFHRIIPGFMAQGGDFESGDGRGGSSVYGKYFRDENFVLKHEGPGTLSMANAGRNTNGSQFFVCTADTPFLDKKHVVFGKLVKGFEVLEKMEAAGTKSGTPTAPVYISDAGVLDLSLSLK